MTFKLSSIPADLQWYNNPVAWQIEPGEGLSVTAGENTDWFVDPAGGYNKDNSPTALFVPADEKFILSAKVNVDFASTYDAGVLQVRESENVWAKLCFEYSPQQKPMIVSVMTRGVSDDCNSVPIDGNEVFLRVARNDRTLTFHYSRDGRFWHLVRYFSLGKLNSPRVGFSSQSPTGRQCRTVFSEIIYRPGVIKDIRSGE